MSDHRSGILNWLATLLFLMELLRHAETDVSRQSICIATSVIDNTNIVESHYSTDITIVKCFIVTWSHHDDYNYINNGSNVSNSLRLRGGMNTGSNPNIRKDLFDIPSLTKARFVYDGLRDINFIENTLYPLRNGLAQVNWKDATLLSCVERTDPGGVLGNPPRAAAPRNIVLISIVRNRMAAGCILNYILPSSRQQQLHTYTRDTNST